LLAQLAAFFHADRVTGLVLIDPTHEDIIASTPLRMRARR